MLDLGGACVSLQLSACSSVKEAEERREEEGRRRKESDTMLGGPVSLKIRQSDRETGRQCDEVRWEKGTKEEIQKFVARERGW